MATRKQTRAAKKNIKRAITAAKKKRTLAYLPTKTHTALSKQAAAVRQRRRSGGRYPKTRAELMKIAQRRKLRGRSKMGRDELARALGQR
jgi:hypothetical protein